MAADFIAIAENTEIWGIAQTTVSAEFAHITQKNDETEIAVIDEFAAFAGIAIIAKITETAETAQVAGHLALANLPKLSRLPRFSRLLRLIRLPKMRDCQNCRVLPRLHGLRKGPDRRFC